VAGSVAIHQYRKSRREVVPAGCYVLDANGTTSILRIYWPKMTERYTPVVGDFWVVYSDGYQSISPKHAFREGYVPLLKDA
jgi:hypothetical protein